MILYDGRVIVVSPEFLPLICYIHSCPMLNLQGKLRGCDPRTNIILSDCVEREYSTDQGVEMIPLGLYMIKGDNVYAYLLLITTHPARVAGIVLAVEMKSWTRVLTIPERWLQK